MLAHLVNKSIGTSIVLTYPITVKLGIEATKLIISLFGIMGLKMIEEGRSHMSMLFARTYRREDLGPSARLKPASKAPDREDNHSEETEP